MARTLSKDDADYEKACMLVGKFFMQWALVEAKVDGVIRSLFRLASAEGYILLANIQFRSKVHILNTAFQRQSVGDDERAIAKKLIGRILRLYEARNLLAHNIFSPMSDGTVEISRVVAKGELKFPTRNWNKTDFERRFDFMNRSYIQLDELGEKITQRDGIIRALMREPTESKTPLADLGRPFGLLSGALNSPLGNTNGEKHPQTNQAPPDKEGS